MELLFVWIPNNEKYRCLYRDLNPAPIDRGIRKLNIEDPDLIAEHKRIAERQSIPLRTTQFQTRNVLLCNI